MFFEWEEIDENWNRCKISSLWLHKPSKWIYELRDSDNTFVPLKILNEEPLCAQYFLASRIHKVAGAATMQGRRPRQEDGFSVIKNWSMYTEKTADCIPSGDVELNMGMLLICDGHGGSTATEYVLENLPLNIKNALMHRSSKYERGLFNELIQASREGLQEKGGDEKECNFAAGENHAHYDKRDPDKLVSLSLNSGERPAKKIKHDHSISGGQEEDDKAHSETLILPSLECTQVDSSHLRSATQDGALHGEEQTSSSSQSSSDPLSSTVKTSRLLDKMVGGPENGDQKLISKGFSTEADKPPSEPAEVVACKRAGGKWSSEIVDDIKSATIRAFEATDQAFLRTLRTARDGCTAAVVYFLGDHVIVAGCGDTRVVMAGAPGLVDNGPCLGSVEPNTAGTVNGLAWYAYRLTVDHKPSLPSERLRITEKGGTVRRMGPCLRVLPHEFQKSLKQQDMAAILGKGTRDRVLVALAVSRAFGDRRHKENDLVIVTPECHHIHLSIDLHYAIVLASDGLWDVMSDTTALGLIQAYWPDEPRQAASALITEAYQRGSMDNLTCTVIFLSQF